MNIVLNNIVLSQENGHVVAEMREVWGIIAKKCPLLLSHLQRNNSLGFNYLINKIENLGSLPP